MCACFGRLAAQKRLLSADFAVSRRVQLIAVSIWHSGRVSRGVPSSSVAMTFPSPSRLHSAAAVVDSRHSMKSKLCAPCERRGREAAMTLVTLQLLVRSISPEWYSAHFNDSSSIYCHTISMISRHRNGEDSPRTFLADFSPRAARQRIAQGEKIHFSISPCFRFLSAFVIAVSRAANSASIIL